MPKKPQSTAASSNFDAGDEKAVTPSKMSLVEGLLGRTEGASIEEITAATGWQPHSARAALSGLRKRGFDVVKEKVDSVTRYRIPAGN